MAGVTARDRVIPRFIDEEMRESFLDYAMSVIVQRALPDVRDGLKPVHRRILYSMHEMGLRPDRPHKKSATVVGDVLGKYHPHGDSAVYDALVRMVQPFSLRYPLVDGQGNFGSIDGDSAAAYRYTEARLTPLAGEVLADIQRETVDFGPNFDDSLQEPSVLPARLPNLLVNGSSGIAVGMSTNIPPHNLGEVGRAALRLLEDPECTVQSLMELLPGPDFPTGGLIVGTDGIRKAYETGRGRVIMRARVFRERRRGGRDQLVVTEIPYATNKLRIIQQIADIARKGRLPDVADLRDESDRDGLRIVLDMKRDGDAVATLKALHRWTSLQATFGVIALALDEGVPRELNLKEILERYRDHRVEVVVRRSRWELEQARNEAHVVAGLLVALDNIDEVVRLIRGSRSRSSAARKLRDTFDLSTAQADAVLAMRLSRLTALETSDLRRREKALERRIGELEMVLASPERQIDVVREELTDVVERFGDARRTTILESDEVTLENLDANETVVVAITGAGYAKQIPMSLYERRVRDSRPPAGMDRYGDDHLSRLLIARLHDTLLLFTEGGRCYGLAVEDLPESGRSSRGDSLHSRLGMETDERIVSVIPVREVGESAAVSFVTAGGTVKRTTLASYANPRAGGVHAIGLAEGDAVLAASPTDGSTDLILVSREGRAIRFPEADVNLMGRTARGVRGMRLRGDDRVIGLVVLRRESTLRTLTEQGWVASFELADIPVQGRGGLGSELQKTDAETGPLVAAGEYGRGERLTAVSSAGRLLTVAFGNVPAEARGSRGAPAVALEAGERIVEIARTAGAAPEEGPRQTAAAEDQLSLPEPG